MPKSQFRGGERIKKKNPSFPVCERKEINVYSFIRFPLDATEIRSGEMYGTYFKSVILAMLTGFYFFKLAKLNLRFFSSRLTHSTNYFQKSNYKKNTQIGDNCSNYRLYRSNLTVIMFENGLFSPFKLISFFCNVVSI